MLLAGFRHYFNSFGTITFVVISTGMQWLRGFRAVVPKRYGDHICWTWQRRAGVESWSSQSVSRDLVADNVMGWWCTLVREIVRVEWLEWGTRVSVNVFLRRSKMRSQVAEYGISESSKHVKSFPHSTTGTGDLRVDPPRVKECSPYQTKAASSIRGQKLRPRAFYQRRGVDGGPCTWRNYVRPMPRNTYIPTH